MKLFETPAFRWKEPRTFLQQKAAMEEARAPRWLKPLLACLYAGMLLGLWALAKLVPGKTPPSFQNALLLAAGGALLFAYGLPWLAKISQSQVCFFSSRIIRQHAGTLAWEYARMRCFEWVSGPEHHVLLFKYGPREQAVCLGLPPEMEREAVTRFLIARGVPHTPPEEQESGVAAKLREP